MSLFDDNKVKLYQSISDSEKERVYKQWHASSLAICPRAHYFKRLGIAPLSKPSAAKILRWQTGHLMEQVIRPHVAKVWGNGEGVDSNQRLTSKKWDMTGEFDNHFPLGETLIEIKTVHDWAIIERDGITSLKKATGKKNKWGKDEYEPMLTPYLHHEIQNHGYKLLLDENKMLVKFIDYVYLTLSGRIVVYHTSVNEKLLEGVKNRLELLNKAWKDKEPPECLCNPDSSLWGGVYQWCDFRKGNGQLRAADEPECCSLDLMEVT